MKKIIAIIAAAFAVSAFAADAVAPVAAASAPVAVKTAQPPVQAEVNKTKLAAKAKKHTKSKEIGRAHV